VRLYRGDLYPDLEAALVFEVRRVKEADPLAPVRVVVPTALARSHLRGMLAEALGGHLAIEVDTLAALAHRLGARGLGDRTVAPHGAVALAAAEVGESRTWATDPPRRGFAGATRTRGFGAAMESTLRDLSDAGLQPQDLSAMALGSEAPDRFLDIADIWKGVRELLQDAGWVEESSLYRSAAAAATSGDAVPTILHGLYDATDAQKGLLAALLARGGVAANVPVGPSFAEPFANWLSAHGAVGEAIPVGAAVVHADLRRAREVLFAEPRGEARGAIEIRSCPSPTAEAREVARVIAQAARGGTRLDRIAVFPRRDDASGSALFEALQDAGIPTDCRLQRATPRHPDAALVLAILEARAARTGRSAWMDVLASPGVRLQSLVPGAAARALSTSAWDRIGRELGLGGDVAAMRRRLEGRAAMLDAQADDGSREAARVRALAEAIGALDREIRQVPERGRPGSSASIVGALALRLLGRPLHADVAHALEEVARLDGLQADVDASGFAAAVRGALDRGAAAAREVGGVTVAALERARGATFELVILPGLVEREFPRVTHGDPILPDEDRAAIREATGRPMGDKLAGDAEERFLLRLALGSARRRVVGLFHRRDAGGRERAPSVFVYALAEAAEGRPVRAGELHDAACVQYVKAGRFAPEDPENCIDARERRLALVQQARRAGDAAALARALGGRTAPLQAEQGRWWTTSLGPWDGRVDAVAAVATGVLDRPLSASRIERWVRCPFRFFVLDLLGLHPEEEKKQSLGLDALQRGLVVHRALQRLVEARIASPHTPEAEAGARGAIRAEVEALVREGAVTHAATALCEADRLAVRIAETLERSVSDPMRPIAAERTFDGVRVAVGDRVVTLRGRIDRVDRSGTHGRVVDYKTGQLHDGLKDKAYLVQLPVYVAAARSLWPEVESWTARLEKVHALEAKGLDPIDDRAASARLDAVLSALVSSVALGAFPQNPKSCQWCAVRAGCEPKGAIERLARRKAADPARQEFESIQSVLSVEEET